MSPADTNEDTSHDLQDAPGVLPVLPLRDNVMLPQTVLPILVGRTRSRELVQWMVDNEHDLLVLTGTRNDAEVPGPPDVFPTGVLARIVQMSRFGDGTYRLVVEGLHRVRIHGYEQTDPYLSAEIELLEDRRADGTRVEALSRQVLDNASLTRRPGPVSLSPDASRRSGRRACRTVRRRGRERVEPVVGRPPGIA